MAFKDNVPQSGVSTGPADGGRKGLDTGSAVGPARREPASSEPTPETPQFRPRGETDAQRGTTAAMTGERETAYIERATPYAQPATHGGGSVRGQSNRAVPLAKWSRELKRNGLSVGRRSPVTTGVLVVGLGLALALFYARRRAGRELTRVIH